MILLHQHQTFDESIKVASLLAFFSKVPPLLKKKTVKPVVKPTSPQLQWEYHGTARNKQNPRIQQVRGRSNPLQQVTVFVMILL